MFLLATAVTATPQAYLHAFLGQPIDVVLLEVILLVGWIPIAAIILEGFMEIWKDQRQGTYQSKLQYCLLAIDVPRMTEQSPMALENVFASLQGAFSSYLWKEIWFDGKVLPRFSLEIASIDGYIQYYIRCETRFRDVVEAGIYAQYPDAQIAEVEDYAEIFPSKFPDKEWDMWGSEMTMKHEEYLPIKTWPLFEHSMSQELKDPLAGLLEQMSCMRQGESFIFQIMFTTCDQKWKEEGIKFIKKTYGIKDAAKSGNGLMGEIASWPGGFVEEVTGVGINNMLGLGAPAEKPKDEDQWKAFKITMQEKNQVEGVSNKITKLGFPTKVRVLYFAKKGVYSKGTRAGMIKGFLIPFNHPDMNAVKLFVPQIPKNDYFFHRWTYAYKQTRLTQAFKKRSFSLGAAPKVFSTEELATIWHFPTILIKAPLIKKTEAKRAEPPVSLPIAGDDEPLYKAAPPSVIKKAAAPVSLPMAAEENFGVPQPSSEINKDSFEPDIKLQSPIDLPKKENPVLKSVANKPKVMPDAMRVLFDPDVELEDVNLPPVAHEAEHVGEDESAPPNLPL